MNWPKAKTIFILLFAGINLILFAVLSRTFPDGSIAKETIQNTRQILLSRNVEVACEIPRDRKALGTLRTVDGQKEITYWGRSDAINLRNLPAKNPESAVFNSMRSNIRAGGLEEQDFFFQRKAPFNEGEEYFFQEKLEGGVVFNNSVRAAVYSTGVTFQIQYRMLEPFEPAKAMMPVNQVLLKHYINTGKPQKIMYIREGYLQRPTKNKSDRLIYIPVWCMMDSEGSVRYFKAGNGEEIII